MRKRLLVVGLLCVGLLLGCGNQAVFDTTWIFDKAIIQLANGEVIEVEVATWEDYDGEQLQIKAKDGTVYLTSSTRCDLIHSKK
jgi:hypothetical protein